MRGRGHRLQSPGSVSRRRHFLCRLCPGVDPGRLLRDLLDKTPAFVADQRGQIAVRLLQDRIEPLDISDPLRDGVAEFIEHRAQSIHQLGALVNQALPRSEQHRACLLLFRLWLDKAHLRALCRNHNRLGIGGVILLSLHEGPHVLRRDQLHVMTQRRHFPCPVMRAAARLHDY
jgi:hypothetical protein